MQRQTIILCYLVLFVWLSACKEQNTTINGYIEHLSEPIMVHISELTNDGLIGLDSSVTETQGNFQLSFELNNPGFFVLHTSDRSQSVKLILFPRDKVFINLDANQFEKTYTLTGSTESLRMKQLNDFTREMESKVDSLNQRFRASLRDPNYLTIKEELDATFQALQQGTKTFYLAFIQEEPTSLANLLTLYQQIAPRTPVFDWKEDFSVYALVDSVLYAHYPTVEVVQALREEMIEARDLLQAKNISNQSIGTGRQAPDFSLPTPKGDTLSLSDMRGQYVLLSFWASWNADSREENKKLLALHSAYRKKDLTIFQVSLDRSETAWKRAIEEDTLMHWHHGSDLGFWDASVVPLYNLRTLPHHVLIDPKGRIQSIGNDLHTIQQALGRIFNQQAKQ